MNDRDGAANNSSHDQSRIMQIHEDGLNPARRQQVPRLMHYVCTVRLLSTDFLDGSVFHSCASLIVSVPSSAKSVGTGRFPLSHPQSFKTNAKAKRSTLAERFGRRSPGADAWFRPTDPTNEPAPRPGATDKVPPQGRRSEPFCGPRQIVVSKKESAPGHVHDSHLRGEWGDRADTRPNAGGAR